ncbi:hypothetical protein G9A89_014323 [Geosiphon pyriformis]|nr:hypothetical protein G9A89_014323 [Geosiphon pyriformis]
MLKSYFLRMVWILACFFSLDQKVLGQNSEIEGSQGFDFAKTQIPNPIGVITPTSSIPSITEPRNVISSTKSKMPLSKSTTKPITSIKITSSPSSDSTSNHTKTSPTDSKQNSLNTSKETMTEAPKQNSEIPGRKINLPNIGPIVVASSVGLLVLIVLTATLFMTKRNPQIIEEVSGDSKA